MQTAFVMEIINERLGDFMSDREIVRWLATPNAQCEGGRAPGYEIAFLRADPVLALVSQMWSGRMAHPIALDRLQGARAGGRGGAGAGGEGSAAGMLLPKAGRRARGMGTTGSHNPNSIRARQEVIQQEA